MNACMIRPCERCIHFINAPSETHMPRCKRYQVVDTITRKQKYIPTIASRSSEDMCGHDGRYFVAHIVDNALKKQ